PFLVTLSLSFSTSACLLLSQSVTACSSPPSLLLFVGMPVSSSFSSSPLCPPSLPLSSPVRQCCLFLSLLHYTHTHIHTHTHTPPPPPPHTHTHTHTFTHTHTHTHTPTVYLTQTHTHTHTHT